MKLYDNIKRLRLENNLSQEELAKRAGYTSRSSIAKIEAGEVDLSQSKIMEFSKIFDVSPSELMGLEDNGAYGNHEANLRHLKDKPELLHLYNEIYNSESLQLLFDKTADLSPEDLEAVLGHIKLIRKARGLD